MALLERCPLGGQTRRHLHSSDRNQARSAPLQTRNTWIGDIAVTSFSDRDTAIRREEAHDLREAYERGRKDARAARRRHPVAMTFIITRGSP